MVIKAVLFDLDGTLLGNNKDKFGQTYFKLLGKHFAYLIPPEKLIDAVYKVFEAMTLNVGPYTNQEVFEKTFYSIMNYPKDEIQKNIDEFHKKDFALMKNDAEVKPEARELIKTAFDLGFDVVIATNPIFPSEAIWQRLSWANVADFPYKLVTTYENSHASKPQLAYYREVLSKINHMPEECLMVGDEDMDMVAAKIGIKTFLVPSATTNISIETPKPDYTGSLYDVMRLLEENSTSSIAE